MIDFDNVKMSKSEGNLLLIRDLLKEIRPEVIRMAFLTTHYRKPINWNDALISDSRRSLIACMVRSDNWGRSHQQSPQKKF